MNLFHLLNKNWPPRLKKKIVKEIAIKTKLTLLYSIILLYFIAPCKWHIAFWYCWVCMGVCSLSCVHTATVWLVYCEFSATSNQQFPNLLSENWSHLWQQEFQLHAPSGLFHLPAADHDWNVLLHRGEFVAVVSGGRRSFILVERDFFTYRIYVLR